VTLRAVTHTDPQPEPISSRDHLLSLFFEAVKPNGPNLIGAEKEKFGVHADGTPLKFSAGIGRIFEHLAKNHGWTPEPEVEGGPVIALVRNGASITLEPGGQLELSGAPLNDVHQVCAELTGHLREIDPPSKELGITWLGLGFHPFAKRSDFEWVPKQRYAIMREYLPARGGHAIDMMLRTSTVQANFDFASEVDAMRKVRVALRLSPATTAMFANSPFAEGKPFGGVTYRGRVWLDVDPDRSGLVERVWKHDSKFDDYVEWALDVPMFLIKRDGAPVPNTGQTFRSFWKSGFQGHHATVADWTMHLNTLFPEVRLKKTIEVRGADAQGPATACALAALWTGIFYDAKALAEAEALTHDFQFAEVSELRERIWREGLRAAWRGAPLAKLCEHMIEIAKGGLERRAIKSPRGNDERVHLKRLEENVARALTPADRLLESVKGNGDFVQRVIAEAQLQSSQG
jgi:glutamate--cysteine ligase